MIRILVSKFFVNQSGEYDSEKLSLQKITEKKYKKHPKKETSSAEVEELSTKNIQTYRILKIEKQIHTLSRTLQAIEEMKTNFQNSLYLKTQDISLMATHLMQMVCNTKIFHSQANIKIQKGNKTRNI